MHGFLATVRLAVAAMLLLFGANRLAAQNAPAAAPLPPPYSYADVADHAVQAATIIDARIRRVREVEAARATGLAPGQVRLYLEGDVQAALYGRDPVARRVSWLVDLPRVRRLHPRQDSRTRLR